MIKKRLATIAFILALEAKDKAYCPWLKNREVRM